MLPHQLVMSQEKTLLHPTGSADLADSNITVRKAASVQFPNYPHERSETFKVCHNGKLYSHIVKPEGEVNFFFQFSQLCNFGF